MVAKSAAKRMVKPPKKSWDACHLSTGDSDFATIHRKNGGFHINVATPGTILHVLVRVSRTKTIPFWATEPPGADPPDTKGAAPPFRQGTRGLSWPHPARKTSVRWGDDELIQRREALVIPFKNNMYNKSIDSKKKHVLMKKIKS